MRMASKGSKGDMSVREAGKKGGEKGGQTTKDRYGTPFYREIGRRGGETVRAQRGHELDDEIGHKGGQKVKELIEAGKRRAAQQAQDATVTKKDEGGK